MAATVVLLGTSSLSSNGMPCSRIAVLKNIFTAIDEVTWDVFNAEKIAKQIDYSKK